MAYCLFMTRGWDIPLVAVAVMLSCFGAAAVYVADHVGFMPGGFVLRQIAWIGIGFALMAFVARIPSRDIFRLSPYFFACGLLLLAACLAFSPIRGQKSWIPFGPVRLQPSEFMKPVLILTLAYLLSSPAVHRLPYRYLGQALVISGAALGLILLQPDAGTMVTYLSIVVAVPFAAGLPVSIIGFPILGGALFGGRILLSVADAELLLFPDNMATLPLHRPEAGAAMIAALFPLAWLRKDSAGMRRPGPLAAGILLALACYLASFPVEEKLKEYQRQRIVAFVHPEADPRGAAYNVIQSEIAIGSGGAFGRGLSGATQTRLGFLPERHTDFVFSAVAETFGFAGAGTVLVAFGVLLSRIFSVGLRSTARADALACAGVAALFALQIAINAGMAVGLVPVMGIPLPFLSYGGSSILSAFTSLGIIQSIARARAESIV